MADGGVLAVMVPQLELLLPELDEKGRRLVLGAVARAAGEGGTGAVARLAGASWQTVADGAAELASGLAAAAGRVRRPGGGRRRLAESDPGLVPALLALVEDSVRGDPGSPLVWTTKSAERLAGSCGGWGTGAAGDGVAAAAGAGVLDAVEPKVKEGGAPHADRDGQFRYISARAKEHLAAGQPVMSVDAEEGAGRGVRAGPGVGAHGQPGAGPGPFLPRRRGGARSPFTGPATSPRTPGSSTSGPARTRPRWRWPRSAGGGR